MVTFIPPYMGEEIKSNAERKMYDVLQELNLKNACVLHSLGLPRHRSKIYGEIDFVVVCERGVACLEIKGGRVECRDGQWTFIDRYGTERVKPEGPFAQVTGNMFSLRDILKKRFEGNPHMKNILMASGVVFPDITFHSDSQEIIPEIIYDRTTEDISEYMNQVFDYWQQRQHREPSKLSPSDIREVVQFLRADFCFIPSLNDRLEQVEQKLVRLTKEQAQLMQALGMNDHLIVEGGAGTGKTLLAAEFARRQLERGARVLYLTYNKNLAHHVMRSLPETDQLKVVNIHALFGEYVPVDVEELQKDPQKYFAQILPERFYDYISEKQSTDPDAADMQYDLLIMDEGQDILKPLYLYSLDCLLKGGLDHGKWAVFYDEKQNIYNPEYQDGMDILRSYSHTKFRLFVNCRNTVQIGTYSAKASGVTFAEFMRENGEEVGKISYEDEKDFGGKIKEIMKTLREGKVSPGDITFLSPKKYQNSKLATLKLTVNELRDDFKPDPSVPVFATIQGFKGLDAKVVILCDVEALRRETFSQYIYLAGTRARTLLYIVGTKDFWEEHQVE
ncbi:NERD domain-containing protein [Jutongia sp.]|uniref:nuclease-related domain-containing DEAD/DEAH box helicase n=1 Tax=Jutongia sp. TaxID=2944204 RepID=UPI003079924B